jgi:hypothetical protein
VRARVCACMCGGHAASQADVVGSCDNIIHESVCGSVLDSCAHGHVIQFWMSEFFFMQPPCYITLYKELLQEKLYTF